MKKSLLSFIALLLVGATLFLCACGGSTGGNTDDNETPGDETPGGDITVFDPSLPMNDPSSSLVAYLYPGDELLAQPATNVFEGTAYMRDDIVSQFEKAELIIRRGRPETPLYGIYTYTHEYIDNQDTVLDAGFTCARISSDSNGWSEDHMLALAENGIQIMSGCSIPSLFNSNPSKSYFLPEKCGTSNPKTNDNMKDINNYDLAGWLNDAIDATLAKIAVWGPRGSFWDEHPNANYNPVRYYEFYNEPNFQYLIPITRDNGADDAYAVIKYQVYAIMQTIVYQAIKPIYNDEIYFVGMSAGGGAQDSGISYLRATFGYKNSEDVNTLLNNVVTPKALVQYSGESDESFNARKESAAKLRARLGLGEGDSLKIDLINTMDVLSTHPYADGNSPFAAYLSNNHCQSFYISETRKAMVASADPKDVERAETMPIWFTECGWQIKGHDAYKEAYPEDYANGIYGGQENHSTNGTSQIVQAAMEVQDYLYGIRNGIDFISYMHMYDTDKCNYGLVNFGYSAAGGRDAEATFPVNNRSPRLTIYAIKTMTEILPNPALSAVIHEGKVPGTNNYLFIYEIESDIGGEIVTTVFSPLQASPAKVAWEDDYALVTDMFGKSQIVKSEGGFLNLNAGPFMLYVRKVDTGLLREHGLITSVSDALLMLGMAWTEKETVI